MRRVQPFFFPFFLWGFYYRDCFTYVVGFFVEKNTNKCDGEKPPPMAKHPKKRRSYGGELLIMM